ncbi:MAG: hypothetical protein AB1325_13870 [Nitrospirota bacterium]
MNWYPLLTSDLILPSNEWQSGLAGQCSDALFVSADILFVI